MSVTKFFFCALMLARVALGSQYVVNSAFEEVGENGVAPGWERAGDVFSIRKGEGYNGTRGLVYENEDPARYRFPFQKISLKPGGRYLVTAMIRTENIRGKDIGAGVCVEFTAGGAYSKGFKGTTDGWVKVAFTSDVPMRASQESIVVAPFVRRGCTGKAWFDEITVTDLARPPIETLTSSVYRDRASEGTVAFIAALSLDSVQGLHGTFEWRDAAGAHVRQPEKFASDCAAIRLPVNDLPVGESMIVFRLSDASGETVAQKSLRFTRFAGPDRRRVRFDARRRTLVDGRPFFPLGIYIDPRDASCLDVIARSPFNCVLPGEAREEVGLYDACAARKLMVVGNVGGYYADIGRQSEFASVDEAERALIARVEAVRHHPALLAWYTADEFPSHLAGVLANRRSLLERLDPDHPTYAVTCHPEEARHMLAAYEVAGSDPYPIGSTRVRSISEAAEWARQMRRELFGVRPIWQVPQIFDWIAHRPKAVGTRAPTYREMRSMVWQAIAEGANGLFCYAFMSLKWAERHDPFVKRWDDVCRVAAEVKARMPLMLSDERPPKLGPIPEGLSARGWTRDGVKTIVLVNRRDAPFSGKLRVDGVEMAVELKPLAVEFRNVEEEAATKRNRGVLLLSFDDALFHNWDKALPLFARYGAHATFFVNGKIDEHKIAKMRAYQACGHSVGLHGAKHISAKPFVSQRGTDAWLKAEIEPQVAALEKAKLVVRNFGYPNSSRTEETDAALKPYFNRLRTGHLFNRDPAKNPLATCDAAFVSREKLVSSRLLLGMGFGSQFPDIAEDLERGLERLAARNEALVLYSHDIKEKSDGDCHNTSLDVLERILAKAHALGVEVVGYDEIGGLGEWGRIDQSEFSVSEAELFVDNQARGRSGHMGHALVDCGNGRILAFNSNTPTNRCAGHSGYGWMEYRVSGDYGRTWEGPRILDYTRKVYQEGRHTALCEKGVRAPDGRIILFFQITDASRPICCEPWFAPTYIESRDGGETWSEARAACAERGRIYDAVVDADSVYFLMPTSPDFAPKDQQYVVYKSTNGGPFVRHVTSIEGAYKGYGAMAFSSDGSLLVYAYDKNDEEHPQYCRSRDGGVTWDKPARATCAKSIRNPQMRRVGDDWFMCGRNGGWKANVPDHSNALVLYHSKNGIDWDEGVRVDQRPDGTGTGYYSCLLPVFEPGRSPRLLLQYSHPYWQHSVNVIHRWIDIP